jgi:DNA-directed RNA polymerase subunit RPC12/RpoP
MPQWRWCLMCWKEFNGGRRDQRYCSAACKQKSYRRMKQAREAGWAPTPANGNETATTLQHGT